MRNKRNLTITVGIPTCFSGPSLVTTVASIRHAYMGKSIQIWVNADRTPIKRSIKNALKKYGVVVTWNAIEGSQLKKIKQMIDDCSSDIMIITQDDVLFDKHTIVEVAHAFQNTTSLTMAGVRVLPLKPITFFESGMVSMLYIVDYIARKWKKSDNYLSASGRCLAFKTSAIKKFRIPQHVINGDMFFYLENKRLQGIFEQLENAKVYIRCPQSMKDQLAPSSRYLYSKEEMQSYFTNNLDEEYKIPFSLLVTAFFLVLIKRPVASVFYLLVRLYTATHRLPKDIVSNPVWKVDASTKSV